MAATWFGLWPAMVRFVAAAWFDLWPPPASVYGRHVLRFMAAPWFGLWPPLGSDTNSQVVIPDMAWSYEKEATNYREDQGRDL